MSEPPPPRPFWPTREEARSLGWGLTLIPVLLLVAFVPVLLVFGLLWLLREGEDWPRVGLRLGVLLGAGLLLRWWYDRAIGRVRRAYATRLSPGALGFLDDPPPPPARSVVAAVRDDWQLLVGIAIGLAIAAGALHGETPLLNVDAAPRRLKGLAMLLAWCWRHEHTARTTGALMALIGLACMAAHARQAWRASGRWAGPVPAEASEPGPGPR